MGFKPLKIIPETPQKIRKAVSKPIGSVTTELRDSPSLPIIWSGRTGKMPSSSQVPFFTIKSLRIISTPIPLMLYSGSEIEQQAKPWIMECTASIFAAGCWESIIQTASRQQRQARE
jgi:hypothetical protein